MAWGASINTPYRADEIFSGAALALIHSDNLGEVGRWLRTLLTATSSWILAAMLLLASHPSLIFAQYFRPYLAAALVGTTLLQERDGRRFMKLLMHPTLAYVGEISYALYVIHPLTMYGWLGTGSKFIKYAKRPLSFTLSFLGAHISTRHYEKRWISFGKKFIASRR